MGPVGSLAWGISGLAKAGYNIATKGNVIGQAAIGAGIGYMTSDSESPTNRLMDTIKGGMIGASVGAGFHALKNDTSRKFMWDTFKSGTKAYGPAAAKLGAGSALFITKKAIEHPFMTAAGIAGVAGVMNADMFANQFSSPTIDGTRHEDQLEMRTQIDQQAMALEHLNMGDISPTRNVSAPMRSISRQHRSFMNSTDGLVQGLHNGRHR